MRTVTVPSMFVPVEMLVTQDGWWDTEAKPRQFEGRGRRSPDHSGMVDDPRFLFPMSTSLVLDRRRVYHRPISKNENLTRKNLGTINKRDLKVAFLEGIPVERRR